jgi:hypothetical protein
VEVEQPAVVEAVAAQPAVERAAVAPLPAEAAGVLARAAVAAAFSAPPSFVPQALQLPPQQPQRPLLAQPSSRLQGLQPVKSVLAGRVRVLAEARVLLAVALQPQPFQKLPSRGLPRQPTQLQRQGLPAVSLGELQPPAVAAAVAAKCRHWAA